MASRYDSHTQPSPEPLWREVTGRVLRRHRHERGERLVETARRAGVSSQYLSEIERGRKDASSELLAAVAGALELSLLDLAREVAAELARVESVVGAARGAGAATRPVTLRSIPAGSTPTATQPIMPLSRMRGPVALAA
ncbi:transcriptional regulator [Gordonia sp. 852002-50816_SCH5313054-c]|uniref:helix-turn-helix domain-containing protein n=1 Tax=unclassified Gordonia (in: high G+C Gram-positive bacteria) TaxID=2657482 RepID=UPI0007EBA376|nr:MULTISPECIES: helix-turn-helix transcriptional regulator [unclassified Gordonia (in: high G+C Gram-positive bacteria)]OBC14148.1 transcriptional regulator [Gordonia sp. 852002-50816_SCH5313054-a]OBC18602.1 transcriptional regulator [Gordonia sp. 852002-50816_SCH5313054-c]